MKDESQDAYNIADLREMARRRLPKGIVEFIDRVLALLGCPGVADLNRDYLVRA